MKLGVCPTQLVRRLHLLQAFLATWGSGKPFFAPSSDRANPQCGATRCLSLGRSVFRCSWRQLLSVFVTAVVLALSVVDSLPYALRFFGSCSCSQRSRLASWNSVRHNVGQLRTLSTMLRWSWPSKSWPNVDGPSDWQPRLLSLCDYVGL
jgi:hypothetical protein